MFSPGLHRFAGAWANPDEFDIDRWLPENEAQHHPHAYKPFGNGARVVLEEASFDQVILWLEALKREHGLYVSDLEMTRRPAPGVVSTTFALER